MRKRNITMARLTAVFGLLLVGSTGCGEEGNNGTVQPAPPPTITTIAGDGIRGSSGDGGPAIDARVYPFDLAVDPAGNMLILNRVANRIRRIDANTGIITTVAGSVGPGFSGDGELATEAMLNRPMGAAVDSFGNIFIADTYNHRIRKVDTETGIITTIAGNGYHAPIEFVGSATEAFLFFPRDIAVDSFGNLFILCQWTNQVRRVDAETGIITPFVGTGEDGFAGDNGPSTGALLSNPANFTLDTAGNLFISDTGNHRIRRVDVATGIITTVAGAGTEGFSGDNGPAIKAELAYPIGISVDESGNVFVASMENDRIRRIDSITGIITTVAGTGVEGFRGDNGDPISANLFNPIDLEIDPFGNLLIADRWNYRIRKVTP